MSRNRLPLQYFTVKVLARIFFFLFVFICAFSPAWGQEKVRVKSWVHDNYGRIVFDWPTQVSYAAQLENNQLVLTFDRKMSASLGSLRRELPDYIEAARLTPDKQQVVITLTRDFDYQTFVHDRSVIVDLSEKRRIEVAQPPPDPSPQEDTPSPQPVAEATQPSPDPSPQEDTPSPQPVAGATQPSPDPSPQTSPSTQPDSDTKTQKTEPKTGTGPEKRPALRPENIAKRRPAGDPGNTQGPAKNPPVITIRTGQHPGFSRVVFDWNRDVPYEIKTTSDKTQIIFQSPATFNLAKVKPIPQLGTIESQTSGQTSQVNLDTAPKARLRHFRTNGKVVVDILSASTDKRPSSDKTVAQKEEPKEELKPRRTAASITQKRLDGAKKTDKKTPGGPSADKTTSANAAPKKKTDKSRPSLTLEISYNTENNHLVLRFKTPPNTLAVAYRRAGFVWIGFDRSFSPTLEAFEKVKNPFLREILLAPIPGLTLLRLDTPESVSPLVLRDKSEWLIELAEQPLGPKEAIRPESIIGRPGQPASIFLPEIGDKRVVRIPDPEVGDEIILIPTATVGRGIQGNRDYIQFILPRTAQGVVVIPYADSVQVTKEQSGIFVGDPDGLYISSRLESELGIAAANSLLDTTSWLKGIKGSFNENRKILLRKIIEAPEEERNQIRLRLAQYYLKHRMYREAKGLLQYMGEIDSALLEDPSYVFLTGVAHYLDSDYARASNYLASDTLLNHPEAALWRAALAAQNRDWDNATKGFNEYAYTINSYDPDIAENLLITAAEAALKTGQIDHVQNYLDTILKNPELVTQPGYVRYLQGKALAASGETAEAADIWRRLARSNDRKANALARAEMIDYRLREEEISLDEAIEEYQGLAFSWRGDTFELTRLKRLAELYQQNGNLRQSLLTLKDLTINFLNHPGIRDVTLKMSEIFADIFLSEGAEDLDPITALSIFQEFRELTPVGERGDQLIEQLIERMVTVDLLDSASELLEQQITFRTQGVKKARSGLKLAMLNMVNEQPEKALNALDISVVPGISEALESERRYVQARALYQTGQQEEAIELIEDDESLDAENIRAELYWQSKKWAEAAEAIGRMTTHIQQESLGAIGRELFGDQIASDTVSLPENTVSAEGIEPQVILRWAVALALSNNKAGLDFLRGNYGDLMQSSPYYNDFSLITQEPLSSSKTMEAIAKQVNEVDQYRSFLTNYRERLGGTPSTAQTNLTDG